MKLIVLRALASFSLTNFFFLSIILDEINATERVIINFLNLNFFQPTDESIVKTNYFILEFGKVATCKRDIDSENSHIWKVCIFVICFFDFLIWIDYDKGFM